MAFAVTHHFPGGTKEQYDASIAAVHPGEGRLPEGQRYHVAGPAEGGWTIVAVFDSKDSYERFRDGTLVPAMQKGIAGGFTSPPQETTMELYKIIAA